MDIYISFLVWVGTVRKGGIFGLFIYQGISHTPSSRRFFFSRLVEM
jgi:hypothetical protein